MKKAVVLAIAVGVSCATLSTFDSEAFARAGGGRTSGSRGARITAPSSRPASPSPYYSPTRPSAPSPVQPAPQPGFGGGFMRNMAGGLLGGFLGGMLFRSLGFAGPGAGAGIGIFDIILLGGVAYFIFRMIQRKRAAAASANEYGQTIPFPVREPAFQPPPVQEAGPETGISHIRSMDPSFTPEQFCDTAMDIFFRVQGSWMNRDLTPVRELLTPEMNGILQGQVDELRRVRMINHLENVAVRKVEVVEAWQESGQDFVTAAFRASLLDYTTDEATGQVVSGSRTEPVPFSEEWTFTRSIGTAGWKLSAIVQV